MSGEWPSGHWPTSEGDEILAALLDRVELAIEQVRAGFQGAPLFVVEAELVRALGVLIAQVKFMTADIRNWSSEISS